MKQRTGIFTDDLYKEALASFLNPLLDGRLSYDGHERTVLGATVSVWRSRYDDQPDALFISDSQVLDYLVEKEKSDEAQ